MSPRIARALLAPIGAAVLACAGNPQPVPVSGAADELAMLAGEWAGEYGSDQTGRSGSIVFQLEAGSDTAHGDVLMVPTGSGRSLHPVHDPDIVESSIPSGQTLAIRFVAVSRGEVRGALEPYHDPGCDCALSTTFTGRIQGDRVSGTFVTERSPDGRRSEGWWRVRRR